LIARLSTNGLPKLKMTSGSPNRKDPAFSDLQDSCGYLTAFYIQSRYPMDWPVATTKDKAHRALEAASVIRNVVRSRLIEFK
jgi:HEPN domain-containing protein